MRKPYVTGTRNQDVLCYYVSSMPNIKYSKLDKAKRAATKSGNENVFCHLDEFGAPFVAAFKVKGKWKNSPSLVNGDVDA